MLSLFSIVGGLFAFAALSSAQSGSSTASSPSSSESGYVGYNLTQSGDNSSAVYETANTGIDEIPDPDVYLHAKVHVGEIDILVRNVQQMAVEQKANQMDRSQISQQKST